MLYLITCVWAALQAVPTQPSWLPPWMQAGIIVAAGFVMLISAMVVAAKKGIRMFSGGVSEAQFVKQIDRIVHEIDLVDGRVQKIDVAMGKLETRMDNFEKRLNGLNR